VQSKLKAEGNGAGEEQQAYPVKADAICLDEALEVCVAERAPGSAANVFPETHIGEDLGLIISIRHVEIRALRGDGIRNDQ